MIIKGVCKTENLKTPEFGGLIR